MHYIVTEDRLNKTQILFPYFSLTTYQLLLTKDIIMYIAYLSYPSIVYSLILGKVFRDKIMATKTYPAEPLCIDVLRR